MKKFLAFIFVASLCLITQNVQAQDNTYVKGKITAENTEFNVEELEPNSKAFYVELEGNDQEIITAVGENYRVGDRVVLLVSSGPQGEKLFFITDYVRTGSMTVLFLLFVAVVILISRKAGFLSILGMAYSFIIIFNFLLPQIYDGKNPVFITLISVALISPISFALSHGLNKKTLIALFATLLALAITSLLAWFFIGATYLNGFGSEEAYFLQLGQGNINIKGIFLAGIIIGTLGILDDATVTQTAIVGQLKGTARNSNSLDIFKKAMEIGHDHIASTVNTLILVYTGASLPLLLLFIQSNRGFLEILNYQIIAEEVVTMLVSSIGLIISIPIATFMAAILISEEAQDTHIHSHHH